MHSLVRLGLRAVPAAFSEIIGYGPVTREQIEVIGLVVEHLTDQRVMESGLLYERRFTDVEPHGPDQVPDERRMFRQFEVMEKFNRSAAA